jgi:hypothetical protein
MFWRSILASARPDNRDYIGVGNEHDLPSAFMDEMVMMPTEIQKILWLGEAVMTPMGDMVMLEPHRPVTSEPSATRQITMLDDPGHPRRDTA